MELPERALEVMNRRLAVLAAEHKGHGCLADTSEAATALIETLREQLPGVDDTTLGAFAAGYTDMILSLETLPPRRLADALETTYKIYVLAASQLLGLYDPGKDILDVEAELATKVEDPAPAATAPATDLYHGQYI